MNRICGYHPETGEELTISVKGNFPFKDPETNKFIVDKQGKVVTPGRERERYARLDQFRAEVPDPRPMASAVAFAYDVSPEEEVKRLLAQADARIAANYLKAEESETEFYDDDFDVPEDNTVDNLKSPFEFVRDLVADADVPRALVGAFRNSPECPPEPKAAEPLTTPAKPLKPSKKGSNKEPELPFEGDDKEGGE